MFSQPYQQRQKLLVFTMQKARFLKMTCLLLLLMTFCLSMTACSIGLKERIVYAGLAPNPEESRGAVIIATNKKIPVTVGGTDFAGKMDIGGRVVIPMAELKYFVNLVIENRKLKEKIKELEIE